jgi:ketosteroid isomerase-like protein
MNHKLGVLSILAAAGTIAGCSAGLDEASAARVQVVEDRLAIEQLIMGDYPRALDGRDWATYAALWTEDGVLVQGERSTQGPEAIEAQFANGAGAPPGSAQTTWHVVSNPTIQIDGDTATGQAYWETISTRTGEARVAGVGYYIDEFRKVDGQWKFASREIVNPARAAAAAAAAAPPEQAAE